MTKNMSLIFAAALTITFSGGLARAHEDHGGHHPAPPISTPASSSTKSEVYCSTTSSDVCAHVHFLTPINSTDEAKLIFHVEKPADLEIKDLKLDIWMDMGNGHGHGSAPVELTQTGFNHYQVTNVWFVMMGQWLIRTNFVVNGQPYQINIPVQVQN